MQEVAKVYIRLQMSRSLLIRRNAFELRGLCKAAMDTRVTSELGEECREIAIFARLLNAYHNRKMQIFLAFIEFTVSRN